ncbi:MAG: PTS sugar transporter subunit IIA [Deltaproteobacteria bacterium]|nr:PTS sugar transporter subunit IIA [Deltaproteobacteria bacterium]
MLLTTREAAVLLKTSERQIYRWVDESEIPFRRVRDQVRFDRTDLLEWATSRRLPVSLEAFDEGLEPEDRAPSLADALRLGGVHHDVPATDRDSALRAVVSLMPMPPSVDREFLIEVLLARESTSSTAIGDGIAIPHVRQPVVAAGAKAAVSVSYLREPVPFGALDGKAVATVFFIVSPTVRTHLQVLAHLARALLDPGFHAALQRRAKTEELAMEAARLKVIFPRAPGPSTSDEGAD